MASHGFRLIQYLPSQEKGEGARSVLGTLLEEAKNGETDDKTLEYAREAAYTAYGGPSSLSVELWVESSSQINTQPHPTRWAVIYKST